MSADNIVYVKKRYGKWWVWHDSASVNPNPKFSFPKPKKFIEKSDAYDYAFELVKKIGYVEYGVNVL